MAIGDGLQNPAALNVLVFSPTPTHPTIQGNRQRVFDMCRAMQSVGAHVTLLYYATEGASPSSARQMRDTWDELQIVFPRGFVNRRGFVRHHAIDDWYDDSIDIAVHALCAQKKFDLCVCNYAWYSRIFKLLPDETMRVIDAHDVFGGRAERFAEIGLDPAWFHTSVSEEKIGLDRADLVIAIQDEEAEILRQRTESPVMTIGFLSSSRFLPERKRKAGERLRVGYIGSGNPFNVASVLGFSEAVQKHPDIAASLDIHIAGMVCNAVSASAHPFVLRGVVDSVSDFYNSMDVIVNPMLGGTGLKIKSLEALSFGKPLVATRDAMAGIASTHPGHSLVSMSAVVEYLLNMAKAPERLEGEIAISCRVFRDYRLAQARAFRSFWASASSAARTHGGPPANGHFVEARG
jgi:polysaccharide biosynthesis protein PslH